MEKKLKVVMLPTEKASHIDMFPSMRYSDYLITHGDKNGNLEKKQAHLYLIPTDEEIKKNPSINEIKEGDWCYTGQLVRRCVGFAMDGCPRLQLVEGEGTNGQVDYPAAKKVIASTDPELYQLHDNGVLGQGVTRLPQIPESFIKAYVEAGGIDEVMVEYFSIGWAKGNTFFRHPVTKEMIEVKNSSEDTRRYHLKLTDNNEVIISDVMQIRGDIEGALPLECKVFSSKESKLPPINEVIITHTGGVDPFEKKMYSKDEVEKLFRGFYNYSMDEHDGYLREYAIEQWIEENL